YKVYIKDASRSLAIPVPANFNINELYCEMLNVEDFAEYLITEKDGFVFEGWYSDEEFKNEFSFDNAITSNMTVYGKWTPVSDDSSDDVIDDSSDDVIDDSSNEIVDDSSEDIVDNSSDDVSNDKETEDAKPGDNGITFFAILLVLSLGAVLAVSKKRA
ncbi:MAG: InlB B-repeat-containing protein, partial [Clostridia bacterium]|nr:InlB B-repeat-containing protein [Clostridia bacterium]